MARLVARGRSRDLLHNLTAECQHQTIQQSRPQSELKQAEPRLLSVASRQPEDDLPREISAQSAFEFDEQSRTGYIEVCNLAVNRVDCGKFYPIPGDPRRNCRD